MANEDAILAAVLSLRDATEQSFLHIENRLDRAETRLDRIDVRIGWVEARLDAVETRLQRFEVNVYRRFDALVGR
jgi:tetrahydromethanopterin S-methyltransferase subunit G